MGQISLFKDARLRRSFILAMCLLIGSLFVNFYAGAYATEKESNYVTDIVLSNTRVYDLDEIFIYGSWALVLAIGFLCFRYPERAPFIVKTITLFVLVRSVFISLTHLAPYPQTVQIDPQSFIRYFVFGGDLFFSGHTGLPFLIALIFWKEKWIRISFIATSLFLGTVVLLAHLHYTIDVLSAFFITYGIYQIAIRIFSKDLSFFQMRN